MTHEIVRQIYWPNLGRSSKRLRDTGVKNCDLAGDGLTLLSVPLRNVKLTLPNSCRAKNEWSFNSLPIVSLSDVVPRHGGNFGYKPAYKTIKGRVYVDEWYGTVTANEKINLYWLAFHMYTYVRWTRKRNELCALYIRTEIWFTTQSW
jgi:hypothetical protein